MIERYEFVAEARARELRELGYEKSRKEWVPNAAADARNVPREKVQCETSPSRKKKDEPARRKRATPAVLGKLVSVRA